MKQSAGLIMVILFQLTAFKLSGQSLELMPGTNQFFGDVQWLHPFDESYRFTLFSRTRLTVDYDNNPDLFTGAYINYTTRFGLGVSLVGRVSMNGAGADAGFHFFKQTAKLTFFGLLSAGLSNDLPVSWFSIFRYRPPLSKKWKLFTGLELYSIFNKTGHVFSVQRARLGLDRNDYQFGFAINLSAVGNDYSSQFVNPGLFLRKEFN